MDIIIALLVAAAGAMGLSKMDVIELARKWNLKTFDRFDLYATYRCAAAFIVAVNLIILAFRKLYELSGGSFFPTYVARTPIEWGLGAFLTSLVFWIFSCCFFHDAFCQREDQGYMHSEARRKKWKGLQWFCIAMLIIVVGYQMYFYGWHIGLLDK